MTNPHPTKNKEEVLTTSQKTAKMYSKFNSDNNGEANEVYTRYIEVVKLIGFLEISGFNKENVIWCPFDKDTSNIVIALKERGYNVKHTHIDTGEDFLTYIPDFKFDILISNPPFSKRTKFFNKINSYNKPYIMLQPLMFFNNNSMIRELTKDSDRYRFLFPTNRMGFITKIGKEYDKTTSFYSFWICKDIFLDKPTFIELKNNSEIKTK